MTRVAALYDIHGNLPALEAVLREVRAADVDLVVIGGDVVPGPLPVETLDTLLALDTPARFIQGNGDREVLAHYEGAGESSLPDTVREAIRWNARQLRPEDARTLGSWPKTIRIEVAGIGEVLFCHATPRSDSEIFTCRTAEQSLLSVFSGLDVPLVVCGHTHMQFDRRVGGVRVVNAGSVGMPFGAPRADWLLLDGGIELRNTSYDLDAAAAVVRETEYPQADEFATRNILHPPAEMEMLDRFSRVELR